MNDEKKPKKTSFAQRRRVWKLISIFHIILCEKLTFLWQIVFLNILKCNFDLFSNQNPEKHRKNMNLFYLFRYVVNFTQLEFETGDLEIGGLNADFLKAAELKTVVLNLVSKKMAVVKISSEIITVAV